MTNPTTTARIAALTLGLAGIALTAAACGTPTPTPAAKPPGNAPTTTAPAINQPADAINQPADQPAAANPPADNPPAASPSAAQSRKPARPVRGCPVSAATLTAAYKANELLANTIVIGDGLSHITCYHDYATARTTNAKSGPAYLVFGYDRTTGTWRALEAGTGLTCDDPQAHLPADVRAHLPGCGHL